MPRNTINYNNTIIYKLVCKDVDIKEIYVGHTTNFTKRKQAHKSDCTNSNGRIYSLYVYKFIRDNGGWDNWSMIEVEKFDATDKNDALKRERYYIESLHATLNKAIPSRTKQEYKQDNKERIKEKDKQYREDNKDHKKDYDKKYTQNNKEKIKQYQSEKIPCECGCVISRNKLSRHKKSTKHINLMENKQ